MSGLVTYSYDAAPRSEPGERLTQLHADFGGDLAHYLGNLTWRRLSPTDQEDVFHEAIRALLVLLHRPGFDPARLLALLKVILCRKAQDAVRRRRRGPSTNAEDLLASLDAGAYTGRRGRHLPSSSSEAGLAELRADLLKAVDALPARQRVVMRQFIEHFEEFGERDTHERLTVCVSAVTGKVENVATIKSLWHAGRKNLIELLPPEYRETYSGLGRESS